MVERKKEREGNREWGEKLERGEREGETEGNRSRMGRWEEEE